MQNNNHHRSGRGRYFDDRSRRNRWNDEGASYTNRTSRSHQNNFRRTRNNSYSHRNQYPYNTYGRNQLAQHDSQNAYNYTRQQYYPPGSTTRSNDYYGNSWFPSYSQDWETSNDRFNNSRSWYYPPEAAWGTSQQANEYQYYPPSNQNSWRSFENAYENTSVYNNRSANGNRSWSSENLGQENQTFWWEDSSDATKLFHEYFWRPNTGGEIRCIVCRRNYTTVTKNGESVVSAACGHLFCTGCINYDNYDSSSNYCWICNIRVSDLWKIFM